MIDKHQKNLPKPLIEPDLQGSPEQELAFAILSRALIDYIYAKEGYQDYPQKYLAETYDWFTKPELQKETLSFSNICQAIAPDSDLKEIILTALHSDTKTLSKIAQRLTYLR